MSESKFTPGPWVALEKWNGGNKKYGETAIEAPPSAHHGRIIGMAYGPNQEANAHLIAAAPSLLKAASRALGNHQDCVCAHADSHCYVCELAAAIRKAKGISL